MIFYFSGTGNSLWVARALGRALGEPVVSMADELKKEQPAYRYEVGEKERILLVFPVHSWGPAIPVVRFIRRLGFTGKSGQVFPPVYAVCTCGDECGHTSRRLRKALGKRGLSLAACYSVQMPNNYVLMPGFSVDPEAVEKRKLQEAPARVVEIAARIAEKTPFSRKEANLYHRGPLPWLKSYVVYPLFTNFAAGKNSFYATEACISCGLCERVCPTDTIRLSDEGRPVWADTCVQCVACIHRCPVRAIEYGKATQKKGRYAHPDLNSH